MTLAESGIMLTLVVWPDRVIGWRWAVSSGPAKPEDRLSDVRLREDADGHAFTRVGAVRAGRRAVARLAGLIEEIP